MTQHSIIEHRANYFYVRLEDDYLALCEKVNQEIEALNLPERASSGPADCKGMILSILEHWMNSKRHTATCEDDLYVYFTYDEWEHQLRYRYKRSIIIRCLKEMALEGQWLDEEDEIHTGLIKSRHHVQNTYAYLLNIPVVQALIAELPEQSPYGPKPKALLGRPKKNRSEINGLKINDINLNRLKTDDINEIPSKNKRNNDEIPSKNKRSFYTQITTNTDYSNTQISGAADAATVAPPQEQELEKVSPLVAPKTRLKPARERIVKPKADLFAEASPEVQAIITEWHSIFKTPGPVTKTLVDQATEFMAWKPVPGEIVQCRLWMYQTDKNHWYSIHGMHFGDVLKKFEQFRSLASIPAADPDAKFVNGKPRTRMSSWSDPNYTKEQFEAEFYPVKPIITRQEVGYAESF